MFYCRMKHRRLLLWPRSKPFFPTMHAKMLSYLAQLRARSKVFSFFEVTRDNSSFAFQSNLPFSSLLGANYGWAIFKNSACCSNFYNWSSESLLCTAFKTLPSKVESVFQACSLFNSIPTVLYTFASNHFHIEIPSLSYKAVDRNVRGYSITVMLLYEIRCFA